MATDYEDSQIIDEYLLFHYGADEEILPNLAEWPEGMVSALGFPKRTVSHFETTPVRRGLDLGCAVGASTFEMARHCDEVIGIDFSHGFIQAAMKLRDGEKLSYTRHDEAHLKTNLLASQPKGVAAEKISFTQGDAMHLPESLGSFERVHAANLLCRLSSPERLLKRLPSLVKSKGELVLATPCTWLEAFTPLSNWPEASTMEWLQQHLSDSFELVQKTDEPFLIRETARKFQWTKSMVTVWRKS